MLKLSRATWGVIALTALAFGVRAVGLGWGLPDVTGEAYPFQVAWDLWGWGPAPFTWNPRFFKYPSLTIYVQWAGQGLLYLGMLALGKIQSSLDFQVLYELDKTAFYLIGRGITATFGAAVVPATWLLTRRLAGSPAAFAASFLVAINPELVVKSQEISPDIPLVFFVTLGAWLALRLVDAPSMRACVLAGAAAGLAVSTKYPGMILILTCGLALALASARSPRREPASAAPARRAPEGGKQRGRKGQQTGARSRAAGRSASGPGSRVIWLMLVLGAAGVALFATSPYLALDAPAFWRDLGTEREHMRLGHFGAGQGLSWGYYAAAYFTRLVGWPLGLATVAAMVVLCAIRRERKAIVAAATILVYFSIVGSWTMKADHYLLPLVPLGIALACAGMAALVARLPIASSRPPLAAAAWLALTLFCAAPLVARMDAQRRRLAPDTRSAARLWIERNVPRGAFIVVEPFGPALRGPADLLVLNSNVAARLERDRPDLPVYGVLSMPLFQVAPERSAPFYDHGLYRAADLFVVSSSVRDRYQADSASFRDQLAFYDELNRRFVEVQRFEPHGRSGPDIAIYRDPAQPQWFAERDSQPAPGPYRGQDTGGENHFFWNLGLIYESAGSHENAIDCYLRGLRFAPLQRSEYRALAIRLGQCLLETRSPADAISFLAAAESGAASPLERMSFEWVQKQIASGRPIFANQALPRLARFRFSATAAYPPRTPAP